VIPIKDNMPTDRFPLVTVALMVAQLVVYVLAGHHAHGVGAIFVNPSILQLIGNLWFLWLFGNNVEDSMGPVRFLVFYLLGGLVAFGLLKTVGSGGAGAAAGAVSAVVAGYVLLYPRAQVLGVVVIPFLFTVIEIPMIVMAALWLALQVVFAAVGWSDYLGVVGGLVIGALAIRPLATRRKPTPPTAAAF
jgi:membrane associated rhomboid family serine protease